MKRKKKKIILASIGILISFLVLYACLAILPFSNKKEVSKFIKEDFSTQIFYGEEEGLERAKILDDPKESFYYRLSLIQEAKEEIIVSSYSTHDGRSTRVFFGALLSKADDGVQISIVLDEKFSGFTHEAKNTAYALINHPNVTLYLYNPIHIFNPLSLNACLHDKYLIIDQQFLILGGRNIGDKYYADDTYNGSISYDREVLVYNPLGLDSKESAITQTKHYFHQIIHEKCCKQQTHLSKQNKKKAISWQIKLMQLYQEYLQEYPKFSQKIDYRKETVSTNKITLVTNPTHNKMKEPILGYTLYQLAQEAKQIYMQSPYTILNEEHLKSFYNIKENSDCFVLLTNSIASTPNLMGYSNYYVRRKEILKTGVDIYEYQNSKDSIHAKTYLFDHRLTAIGSFNLDERSMHIDTESMLIIDSIELNLQAKEIFLQYMSQSLQVGEDNQYIPGTMAEAETSTSKKIKYKIMGTIGRPFVSLL